MKADLIVFSWIDGLWRAHFRSSTGEEGRLEGRANPSALYGIDDSPSLIGSSELRNAMWNWWNLPDTRRWIAERPGSPVRLEERTTCCENCTHFEPDTFRCVRDPIRFARDRSGKRIELAVHTRPDWSCESFDRYAVGTVPERRFE